MATAAEIKVCNQALSALGSSSSIEALDEVSREAEQCNLWYETVRDMVFRAAPWPCLTAYFRLAVYATRDNDEGWVATDPPPGWLYAFSLPSDHIRPRNLSDYSRFELTRANGRNVIAANSETPILHYTSRIEDPGQWDPDLYHAIVFGLAAHIAKPITGNDADMSNMFTVANEKVLVARANAANINQAPIETNPEWLTARGQAIAPSSRYFYPSADFTLSGFNSLA